jgi:hypothetical protein
MADWTQAEAIDDNWAIQNANDNMFDGSVFDPNIFEASPGFRTQTTPDPNWN